MIDFSNFVENLFERFNCVGYSGTLNPGEVLYVQNFIYFYIFLY